MSLISESDNVAAHPHPHRLQLQRVDLIGGGRSVDFYPGLNVVTGHITTGKTTLVRLIRALLGTVPDALPPETEYVRAVRGEIVLGDAEYQVYRPLTRSAAAQVEIAERTARGRSAVARRLPAAGERDSYSTFLLEQLAIPAVSVPAARARPTENLTPVSMTDWLGYCIVPGDELDTQVFGHHYPFRDIKRKRVFELVYGLYDGEVFRLYAELRSVEQQLDNLDRDAAWRAKFLADTPFGDAALLDEQLAERRAQLASLREERARRAAAAASVPEIDQLRGELTAGRERRAQLADVLMRLDGQLKDLSDLARQLESQRDRLTRAIVAGEWLVDFDFVLCPRCGNDVDDTRAEAHACYLCLQPVTAQEPADALLAEQSRIIDQISETNAVAQMRQASRRDAHAAAERMDGELTQLAARLDAASASFVSEHAARLESRAAEQARLEADIARLLEYRDLILRHSDTQRARASLDQRRTEIQEAIAAREFGRTDAEEHIRALEKRLRDYLQRLHVPEIGQLLTVGINRKTYLPEISGRRFEELSSQGLKTLVNIAHALAHHTVAIDRRLPLPGLLVLDGLSANSGFEGFDQDRVHDVYQLLVDVSDRYGDQLQLIAVDNELPASLLLRDGIRVVLTLRQDNRLIRPAGQSTPPATPGGDEIG